MDDIEAVRLVDGLAGLQDEVDGLLDGEGSVAPDPLRQIAAIEVLHDDVRHAILDRDVAHSHDMLALDPNRRASFPHEAPQCLGMSRRLGGQKLDGDLLVEEHVVAGDHGSHCTLAQHLADTVFVGEDFPFEHSRRPVRHAMYLGEAE